MALQHLRASTADKRPTPAAMADGQLAMNTNLASPGLFFKDSNGDLVKTGPVHVGTTAPNATPASGGQAGNSKGELWLDTTGSDYTLKTWDGSAWREIVVTSTMIKDGTIVNADINASAAIAGTKISPDFGSQNVVTTGTATAASLSPTGSSVPTNGVYLPAANSVAISTNGTGRLFVDANGRVGIFSAPTAGSFSVNQFADNEGITLANTGRGASYIQQQLAGASNEGFNFRHYNGTSHQILNGSSRTEHYWNINGSEVVRIDSSGRLGLGTSSPGFAFDCVAGSAAVVAARFRGNSSGNNNTQIRFYGASAATDQWAIGNAIATDDATRNFDIYDLVSNANRLRIDSSGNVGIGSTSPSSTLDVVSASTSVAEFNGPANATVSFTGSGFVEGKIQCGGEFIVGSTNNYPVAFVANNTERARIDTSGRLLVGTSSASSTSNGTQNGALAAGGGGTVVTTEKQVLNNGTLDITVGTSTIGFWSGFLFVNNINASAGSTRTQTTFSAFGDNQNGVGTFSTIHSVTSGGGQSFAITYVATGIIRFTNTSGSTCNVSIGFFGGGININ